MGGVRVLGPADRALVESISECDPVRHVFLDSRLEAGVLVPGRSGELWGFPAQNPRSLMHVGANLVPCNTDAAARAAFGERLGPRRPSVSIVGPQREVFDVWEELADRWGGEWAEPRAVRETQPVLTRSEPSLVAPDPRVVALDVAYLEPYFLAAAAMYTEELGEDPRVTNATGYRSYVRSLMTSGRAFGIVEDGRVVFKADIGAMSNRVAQVQGVWLAPDLRGRGLAPAAMAAVTNAIVAQGRTASLYVNDFNRAAIATYLKVGYTQVDTFATVLF